MTSALHALVYNNPSISADGLYIMLTRSHNLCFPLIHLFLEIISVIQLANDELINLIYFACKNEGMRMRQIPSANLLQLLSFFLQTKQFIIFDRGSQTVVLDNCVIHLPLPVLITLVRLNLLQDICARRLRSQCWLSLS